MNSFTFWLLVDRGRLLNGEFLLICRTTSIFIFDELPIVSEICLWRIASFSDSRFFLITTRTIILIVFFSVLILLQTIQNLLNFWIYLIDVVNSVIGISFLGSNNTFSFIIIGCWRGSNPFISILVHQRFFHIFNSFEYCLLISFEILFAFIPAIIANYRIHWWFNTIIISTVIGLPFWTHYTGCHLRFDSMILQYPFRDRTFHILHIIFFIQILPNIKKGCPFTCLSPNHGRTIIILFFISLGRGIIFSTNLLEPLACTWAFHINWEIITLGIILIILKIIDYGCDHNID